MATKEQLEAEVQRLRNAHGQGELNEQLKDPVYCLRHYLAGVELKIEDLKAERDRYKAALESAKRLVALRACGKYDAELVAVLNIIRDALKDES